MQDDFEEQLQATRESFGETLRQYRAAAKIQYYYRRHRNAKTLKMVHAAHHERVQRLESHIVDGNRASAMAVPGRDHPAPTQKGRPVPPPKAPSRAVADIGSKEADAVSVSDLKLDDGKDAASPSLSAVMSDAPSQKESFVDKWEDNDVRKVALVAGKKAGMTVLKGLRRGSR